MAEFCAQCAKELDFDPDWAGMISPEECAKGMSLGPLLCEGCGVCYVDHRGACLGCDTHPDVSRQQLIERTLNEPHGNRPSL